MEEMRLNLGLGKPLGFGHTVGEAGQSSESSSSGEVVEGAVEQRRCAPWVFTGSW